MKRIGLVMGARKLLHINTETCEHNPDNLLGAFGELFLRNVRFYIYPAREESSANLINARNLPVPADIHFENLSIPLDSNYLVEWDFGDGNKAHTQNANHVYTKPGTYSISMSIKALSGCVTKESFHNFVIVQDGPEADFDFEPKELTLLNPSVRFTNLAREALNVTWNFGDNLASSEKNPIHKYLDTGRYIITQIARHENGCIDTISKLIRLGLNISYFLPNAFTPNNDGINDIYIGTGSTIGMRDFSMKIFTRWGEQIYYSEDPRAGWNGRKNNKGNLEAKVIRYKPWGICAMI